MHHSLLVKKIPAVAPDSFLETKRNEFLAALYLEKGDESALALDQIHKKYFPVLKDQKLCENDEKILNQIFLIIKKFNLKLKSLCPPVFFHQSQILKQMLLNRVRNSQNTIEFISYETWQKSLDLSDARYQLLFKTAMNFQLTKGCSNFCRRCNEWAIPSVRGHFTFSAVQKILNRLAEAGNPEISLYGASDPLDYVVQDKTICDIIDTIQNHKIDYSLLTKLPKGKTALLSRLIETGANISVSVTARNKKRIQKFEKACQETVAKQHDTDDLLIPACLDEDFQTVKPSITDGYGTEITPDGAFIIIPTFTSALHPFGHQKIKIKPDNKFFPVKKTGRHALLVDYFKPIQCYGTDGNIFYPDTLFDVQIESILLDNGADTLTPPGMRSVKEYFSIFDTKARLQRKKMTRSVIKKLKKKYLKNQSFKKLSPAVRQTYLIKIKSHFDLCRKARCMTARKDTAAYFLKSIRSYCKKNPTKKVIIRHLLKTEMANSPKKPDSGTKDIALLLLDEQTDAFALFRELSINIVFDKQSFSQIDAFIHNHPASYHPVADIFCLPQAGYSSQLTADS